MPIKVHDERTFMAIMREKEEVPLLTHDQFLVLWSRWSQTKDEKIFDQLFRANLRGAYDLAYKASLVMGIELADAYQAACIALARSIRKYDPGTGRPFSSYAWPAMKRAIRTERADNAGTIRVPTNYAGKIRLFKRTRAQLTEEKGEAPTTLEVAQYLGWSERDALTVERIAHTGAAKIARIDKPLDHEPGILFGDHIEANTNSAWHFPEELQEQLKMMMSGLKEVEVILMIHRVLAPVLGREPLTFEQVGALCGGLPKQRMQQIEGKLLPRLRTRYIERFGRPN